MNVNILDMPSVDGQANRGLVPGALSVWTTAVPNPPLAERRPPGVPDDFNRAAISGIHVKTDLNQRFFAAENIAHLQKELVRRVWLASDKRFAIGPQDEDTLKLIMRSTYLTYARHRIGEVAAETAELNERVLEYAVPDVVAAARQHIKFLTDVGNPVGVAPHPTYVDSAGMRGAYSASNVRFF